MKSLEGRISQISMTSTEWSNSNPILYSGEIGFDSTLNIFKIGDGINAWDELGTYYPDNTNVDTELSSESDNAISNSAVTAAIEELESTIAETYLAVSDVVVNNTSGSITILDKEGETNGVTYTSDKIDTLLSSLDSTNNSTYLTISNITGGTDETIEITTQVPSITYITELLENYDFSGYVTSDTLTSTLEDYLTTSDVTVDTTEGTITVSDNSGNTIGTTYTSDKVDELVSSMDLSDYVTSDTLTSTLEDYLTTSDVTVDTTEGTITVSDNSGNTIGTTYTSDKVDELVSSMDLSDYVTSDTLTSTLTDYLPISGGVSGVSYYHTDITGTGSITIDQDSEDLLYVTGDVTISNGTSGTAWVKQLYIAADDLSVTLGDSWSWDSEPSSIESGYIFTLTWIYDTGIISSGTIDLTEYVTESSLTDALTEYCSDYVTASDLTDYLTSDSLSSGTVINNVSYVIGNVSESGDVTVSGSTDDITYVTGNITMSDGDSGTAWIKQLYIAADDLTLTLSDGWSWKDDDEPTLAAGDIVTAMWVYNVGVLTYI